MPKTFDLTHQFNTLVENLTQQFNTLVGLADQLIGEIQTFLEFITANFGKIHSKVSGTGCININN